MVRTLSQIATPKSEQGMAFDTVPTPDESSRQVLEVINLEAVYNEVVLVTRGVSLSVKDGKIVTLLGANGAGKSTTMKAISGLLQLEGGDIRQGEVRLFGERIDHLDPSAIVKRGLFQVMEGRGIVADMTVRENLRLGAYSLPGPPRSEDFDLVFRYFPRLKERLDGTAGYLSGGEQQMLAIGRALMGHPKFILMDEPSMGLSPMLTREVFSIIATINKEQSLPVLLVEQNANMALGVADFGYIMESGRIVMEGTAEQLRNNEDIKEFYLGTSKEGQSFRDLKSFKRRKRWL
jgi:branched-chain amino acid transport system ATP-binding protein